MLGLDIGSGFMLVLGLRLGLVLQIGLRVVLVRAKIRYRVGENSRVRPRFRAIAWFRAGDRARTVQGFSLGLVLGLGQDLG